MVTLFTSADINFLADELSERISYTRELSSFFKHQPSVIVQNAGMEQWIKLQLARRKGAFAEVDVSFPAAKLFQLQREVLGVDDIPRSSRWYISRRIALILYKHRNDPLMKSATRMWRDADQNPVVLERKRWVLAEQIADAFDEYELYRTRDIESWIEEGDDWQKFIMRNLYDEKELFRYSAAQKTIDEIEKAEDFLNDEYHIFVLPGLVPHQIEMFSAISKFRPVYFYVVYPFSDSVEMEFRLNTYLGSQIIDYVNIIKGKCGAEIINLDQIKKIKGTGHILKSEAVSDLDLLKAAVSGKSLQIKSSENISSSIHVASTHNSLREVEVLHDWLSQLSLQDDTLKSDDILIVSPQMDTYRPFLDAVFQNADSVYPRSFELSFSGFSGREFDAVHSVQHFIDVLKSRCTTTDILEFLDFQSVRDALEIQDADIDLIRRWLDKSGIRWGLNAEQKSQWNLPQTSENTWDFGLKRLMLGLAAGNLGETYRGVLPLNEIQKNEDAELLGKISFLIRVISSASKESDKRRTMTDWLTWMRSVVEQLIGEESAAIVFSSAQRTIEKTEAIMEPEEIPYDVFASFIRKELKQSQTGGGRQSGTVLCADMVPMRSLPYKVIAVLGLNDGAFPRAELRPAFSYLATQENRPGDRSRKADDRLLLLETILATQKNLFLSYQGKNQYTNEEIPASSVLSQLITEIETIRRKHSITPVSPVQKYPLQAHSSQYVPYGLEKTKENHISTTAFGRFYTKDARNFWDGLFETKLDNPEKPVHLDWSDAVKRLVDPVQMFIRYQLGIYVREFDLFDKEDEPFALNSLEEYSLLNDFLREKNDRTQLNEEFLQAAGISPSRQQSKAIIKQMSYKLRIYDELEGQLDLSSEDKDHLVLYDSPTVNITGKAGLRDGWLVRKSASRYKYKYRLADTLTNALLSHMLGDDFKGMIMIAPEDSNKKPICIHKNPAIEESEARNRMEFLNHLLSESFIRALPFNESVAGNVWDEKNNVYKKPAKVFDDAVGDYGLDEFSALYVDQDLIKEWLTKKRDEHPPNEITFQSIEQTFRNWMNGGSDDE